MRRRKIAAFTLIEIMVVVVILGILAAIIVPQIVGRPDEARVVKAKQDVLALENALELYKLDNGVYPSTNQGLQSLIEKPTNEPVPRNWKRYLKDLPDDPWGRSYMYLNPGENLDIDVFSYGANGQPGGDGFDADIGNWNVRSGSKKK